jgi:dienelactone hydrolase
VVLLPAWKERTLVFENLLASAVAGKGFAALLLPMPWQATRNADGVRPGDWTFSADLARTREAWMQGFADVAAASLYLERWRGVPTTRQGVFGVSLGGHVAACAYGAYPERFRAGVFVLAGGGLSTLLVDPPKGLRDLRFTLDGATAEDVKALVGDLDPERWADPARKDGVFLVGAKADELVPARHVEILAKAYGGADVLWLEGGHYDGLKDVDRVLAAAVEHLKRCFGPPR